MALERFQMREFQTWKGMTTDNALASLGLRAPQAASNLFIKLLAFQKGRSTDSILTSLGVREFDDDTEITWNVCADARENLPLVEARTIDGNVVTAESGMIGKNGGKFYLVFDKDYFADQEEIIGNLGPEYIFRILRDATMEGINAVYEVELMGGNIDGCPAERLLRGEEFSVFTAYVESELSREAGDIRFNTPVSMRNEWSNIRIQHKVAGNKLGKKCAFGIPMMDKNGGKHVVTMWMQHVDWLIEQQFADYKNNAEMFGKSNRNRNGEYRNIGKSGNVIKTGAGLYEQMEAGNIRYYSTFSLKLLEDSLLSLSASRIPMKDRKFIVKTGERGAMQFSKAVMDRVSGWSWAVIDNSSVGAIRKTTSAMHENSLGAGFQFTEYYSPNGLTITIDVDPQYESDEIYKVKHPNGGYAYSYRYDIMFIGTTETPNIFKCQIKGQPEFRGYQAGFRNPFTGETNNAHMSWAEDSAKVHKYATFGVCVLDPTRTMSLVPNILSVRGIA